MLLIGNKMDKADKREVHQFFVTNNTTVSHFVHMKVSKERGLMMAQQHGMMFMECSAKSNVGIQRAFEELSEKILERQPAPGASSAGLNVGAASDSASYGCGC
jgi:GTPase SAR1 family protein